MEKVASKFLDLSRMEVLRRVRLRPKGLSEGTFSGPHKSHYRGTSVEFADYRDYVEGDDIRLIDWKVFARSDRYYVRLYEAERNLLTYLVLDKSGSMEYAGTNIPSDSKLLYASKLAAAMGYLVIQEGDEVGISIVDQNLHHHVVPRRSWTHLNTILNILEAIQPEGKTNIGACLEEVYARVSRRGVIIVLSDFLDESPQLWKSIDLFRRSHFDVILFHIVHPEEIELPEVPTAKFVGTEGETTQFKAEPDVIRDLYRKRFSQFLHQVEDKARIRGCDWFLARTDSDPYLLLKKCFIDRDYQI